MRLMIVPILVGMVFGAVFQLSRVHESFFIRDQMLMRHFLMLKMFLSASATSICVLAILPFLSSLASTRITTFRTMMTESVGSKRGVPSLIVGGACLGLGMTLTGSCPGTVFAQIAAGSVTARWILLGGLIGGALYPLLETVPGFLEALSANRKPFQRLTLPQLLGSKSSLPVALAVAGAFFSIVTTVEFFSPWKKELADLLPSESASFPMAIPPYLAGMVVGSLQLPLILVVDAHLGCSSSYVTVVASLLDRVTPALVQRVPLYTSLKKNNWQVYLMIGVMIGSFTTSTLTGPFMSDKLSISPVTSMFGGFLLTFGARLAAACTSGHGISGMGYLALNSFIAVAAMFAAGMGSAFILYY